MRFNKENFFLIFFEVLKWLTHARNRTSAEDVLEGLLGFKIQSHRFISSEVQRNRIELPDHGVMSRNNMVLAFGEFLKFDVTGDKVFTGPAD